MRICIDMGHTPASPGASGFIDELDKDRTLGPLIIDELRNRGHEVYNSTPEDSMTYPDEVDWRVRYDRINGPFDLFFSIHFNAGGGAGTEVLYFNGDETGLSHAERISSNVARCLGIKDRGAKPNDWVGVVANTYSTAVLLEVCFVDSYDDCIAWYDTPNDEIVAAICDGIEGKRWERAILQESEQNVEIDDAKLPPKHGQDKAAEADLEELAVIFIDSVDKMLKAVDNQELKQRMKEHLREIIE